MTMTRTNIIVAAICLAGVMFFATVLLQINTDIIAIVIRNSFAYAAPEA